MIDEYKNCENCSHVRCYIKKEKFLCEKMHFVLVGKQKFFYSPDDELKDMLADKNPFFMNKYFALSKALECKDYDPVCYAVIDDVQLQNVEDMPAKSKGKYPSIIISVLYIPGGRAKTITYENMSYGSKTRQYFIKVKNYIEIQKECNVNICKNGYGK